MTHIDEKIFFVSDLLRDICGCAMESFGEQIRRDTDEPKFTEAFNNLFGVSKVVNEYGYSGSIRGVEQKLVKKEDLDYLIPADGEAWYYLFRMECEDGIANMLLQQETISADLIWQAQGAWDDYFYSESLAAFEGSWLKASKYTDEQYEQLFDTTGTGVIDMDEVMANAVEIRVIHDIVGEWFPSYSDVFTDTAEEQMFFKQDRIVNFYRHLLSDSCDREEIKKACAFIKLGGGNIESVLELAPSNQ